MGGSNTCTIFDIVVHILRFLSVILTEDPDTKQEKGQ